MSSAPAQRLRAWRLFFETALALNDLLDDDFQRDSGFPIRWYDVLVHLEETPDGLRMNELAEQILYSKSGLTRVIDQMEQAGLIRRYRPDNDRRSVFVLQTDNGREAMTEARRHHHAWIEQHFSEPLADSDIQAVTHALEKLSAHVRPLRPGRISG
ncbi:MAG: MarR family winged helix-turn-helix transcriptional regulator [Solirubrobacteraceae bacterium]